jgi:hypothetical protein
MPASNGDYYEAFQGMVGHAGAEEAWYGERIGGWNEWKDLFEQTGIQDDNNREDTIDAFENFLVAFYPQEGLSKDEWEVTRSEFADLYGFTDFDDDFWAAWRAAIGY